jgi:hypothetical protein
MSTMSIDFMVKVMLQQIENFYRLASSFDGLEKKDSSIQTVQPESVIGAKETMWWSYLRGSRFARFDPFEDRWALRAKTG